MKGSWVLGMVFGGVELVNRSSVVVMHLLLVSFLRLNIGMFMQCLINTAL